MKPLVIGQAPGRRPGPPLEKGRNRISLLFGVSADSFDATNVLDRYPGKSGKGDAFPMREARNRAEGTDVSGRLLVVLAGKNTARAFGVHAEYFVPAMLRGVPAVVVPHPSGVNRWWNDQSSVASAISLLSPLRCLFFQS